MGWWPERLLMIPPIVFMALLLAFNHVVTHHRARRQAARDAKGLRVALRAELDLLGRLIEDNLSLLRRREEYLLSLRVLTQVYRGNLGRLNLLSEAEIDGVVRAYGAAEAAELFIGATSKPHGSHAYRVWLDPAAWNAAAERLMTARIAVDAARDAVAPRRGGSTRRNPVPERNDAAEFAPATA